MRIKINKLGDLSFTQEEENFIKLLEVDEFLESFVKEAREIIKQHKFSTKSKEDTAETVKLANTLGGLLVDAYEGLPARWYITFSSIITSGYAIPPLLKDTPHIELEGKTDENPTVNIKIDTKISVKQLKEFIDNQREVLNGLLAHLPKEPTIAEENIEVKNRIGQLRKEGKTFPEIAEILYKEFGDNLTFSPDYEVIAVIYNRFQKNMAKTIKKNPDKIAQIMKDLESLKTHFLSQS